MSPFTIKPLGSNIMNLQETRRGAPGTRTALYRYAQVVAGSVVLLLVAGAMVTSTGSGLSVPDWPLSFGQVMPPMQGGVFYEHGHRMIAAAVGVLTIILAVWIWIREPRAWMRRLGWIALGLVVVQGVLGGMTVLLKLPVWTSAAHASLAQGFFMVTVFIALALSPGWNRGARMPEASDSRLPIWATAATLAIYVQLVIGAVMRHLNAGLVIPDFPLSFGGLVPAHFTPEIAIAYAHRVWALVTFVVVVAASVSALRTAGKRAELASPAILMLILVTAQVTLGAFIIWTQRQVHVTTTHVVTAAILLAVSLVLTARSWHALRLPRTAPETLTSREGAIGYGKAPA